MAKDLTQLALDNIKPGPARREIPDGKESGLYLILQPSGSKSWALRYRIDGKSRKLTLGAYPAVSLRQARALASGARSRIAAGIDVAAEKQTKRTQRQADTGDLVDRVSSAFYISIRTADPEGGIGPGDRADPLGVAGGYRRSRERTSTICLI